MDGSAQGGLHDRAIVRTFFAGAGLQITIAVSTLVALPFVTRELTAPEFGVFATLTGFTLLLSFADFGIGGALTTDLARAISREEWEDGRRAVSTAAAASLIIGAGLATLLALSTTVLPWRQLLGAQQVAHGDLLRSILVVAVMTGLSVPASLGQRLMYGVRRGPAANYVLCAAACIGAALLVVGSRLHWSLSAFVAVSLGAPVVGGLVCGISALYGWPSLRPDVRHASLSEWKRMRASSGWHFAIGLAGAVSFQTDALVVSSVLGAAAAGVFAIAVRLFGLVTQALYPAMIQLWPAMSDAYERRDLAWIRSRLARVTSTACGISLLAGVVLSAFGPRLIGLVLEDQVIPPRELLVALTCWTTYSLVSAPSFLLLNATGRVRVHALTAITIAALNFPASILLTHVLGIAGPIWASLATSAVVSLAPWLIVVRRVLAEGGQSSAE